MVANLPGAPGDGDTLSGVLTALAADGFGADVQLVDGGLFRWRPCGHHSTPAHAVVERTCRLEGASDPADMAIVLGLRCPTCGERGSVVLAYGENASPAEAEALLALGE